MIHSAPRHHSIRHLTSRRSRSVIGLPLAVVAMVLPALVGISPSRAESACVVCSEPAAIYRCVAEDATGAVAANGNRAAHFVCITEIARRNGHGSCLIRRDMAGSCDAPEQRVSVDGTTADRPAAIAVMPPPPPAQFSPPRQAAPDPIARPADAPLPPATPNVPTTMVEVARNTADASDRELNKAGDTVSSSMKSAGDSLKKTGKVVGDAVTSTFDCIASFFKRCGG